MKKLIKTIVSTTAVVGLVMGNITINNNVSSLSFNFGFAYANEICKSVECIEITGTKWGTDIRPSAPEINWEQWGSDAWVGELSASRDRAGTGEAAHYMKLGECMYMAQKAAISCKQTVAGHAVLGGLICIAGGVFFTPAAGAACGTVVTGAVTYDALVCDDKLQDDLFFCKTKI